MSLADVAQLVLGSGVLTGAVAYTVQKVPLAIVEFSKKRMELQESRKKIALEKEKAEAETKRLEAEKNRDWQEDTGKIYRDQRGDLENARKDADDCEQRVSKLAAECADRDHKNQVELAAQKAQLDAQQHEIVGVRTALKLHAAALQKLERNSKV